MALRINELFNGTNAVACDTVNTTATGFTGAGTSVFDTSVVAEGTSSARFSTTAGLRQAQWTLTSVTDGYLSFYVTPQALPSANTVLLVLGTTPAAVACTVVYQATGVMKLGDSTGTVIGSFTTGTLVVGELNRVDLTFNSGAVKMEVYPGNAAAGAAVGTALAGNTRAGTTAVTAYAYRAVGNGTTSTLTSNIDAFREDDTALPAPIVAAGAPLTATLVNVPTSGNIPFTVTSTCTASGGTGTPKTYAWAWGDGATTAAGASASATHQFSTVGTFTVVCTITNT